MGRMPWATYLWPGLPRLCREGTWWSLAVAVGFGCLVNLALMATLLWSELFTPLVRNLVCVAAAVIWGSSVMLSYGWDRRRPSPSQTGPAEDTFREALNHYLKGNWFESEQLVRGLLARNARDLDAGLMLATLLRHTGRFEEAERQLDRIERFDGCEKWELEVSAERESLTQARNSGALESAPQTAPGPADSPTEMADAA
jgi:hypothetical protein